MPFQDWHVRERLSRIARSYARAGHPVEMYEHRIRAASYSIGPGATQSFDVRFDEADFVWLAVCAWPWFQEGQNSPLPNFNPRIFVRFRINKAAQSLGGHIRNAGESDREWIPLIAVSGYGRQPFVWPFPYIFAAGDQMSLDVSNLGNNAPAQAIDLIGVRLFRRLAVA